MSPVNFLHKLEKCFFVQNSVRLFSTQHLPFFLMNVDHWFEHLQKKNKFYENSLPTHYNVFFCSQPKSFKNTISKESIMMVNDKYFLLTKKIFEKNSVSIFDQQHTLNSQIQNDCLFPVTRKRFILKWCGFIVSQIHKRRLRRCLRVWM